MKQHGKRLRKHHVRLRRLLSLTSGIVLGAGVLAIATAGTAHSASPGHAVPLTHEAPGSNAASATLGGLTIRAVPDAHARPGVSTDLPEITICLTNSSGWCANVENNDNVSGEPVWLWSSKGGDEHWYETTEICPSGGGGSGVCTCPDVGCIEFEDVQDTGLCLAANSAGDIALQGCGLPWGTDEASWIQYGTHLQNYFWTDQQLMTFSPLRDGDPLYVNSTNGAGTNAWFQWTGP
jgi:hypothetical protein